LDLERFTQNIWKTLTISQFSQPVLIAEKCLDTLNEGSLWKFHLAERMSVRVLVSEDRIVQSQDDKRKYRVLRLTNDLEAILVSDPDTDTAAASMDVHVGHFS
jgi:hypothetical protein